MRAKSRLRLLPSLRRTHPAGTVGGTTRPRRGRAEGRRVCVPDGCGTRGNVPPTKVSVVIPEVRLAGRAGRARAVAGLPPVETARPPEEVRRGGVLVSAGMSSRAQAGPSEGDRSPGPVVLACRLDSRVGHLVPKPDCRGTGRRAGKEVPAQHDGASQAVPRRCTFLSTTAESPHQEFAIGTRP
jgi:hypothetical protein